MQSGATQWRRRRRELLRCASAHTVLRGAVEQCGALPAVACTHSAPLRCLGRRCTVAAPQPTQCSPHRLPLLLPQVRVPGSADGVGVDKDPLQQLSNVKMCMMCQAQGTVKRQYGFRVMDEQCENCNGEGCIITRPPSTADKIAKVEALIASATDLDSLQRCVHMRMHVLHGHGHAHVS